MRDAVAATADQQPLLRICGGGHLVLQSTYHRELEPHAVWADRKTPGVRLASRGQLGIGSRGVWIGPHGRIITDARAVLLCGSMHYEATFTDMGCRRSNQVLRSISQVCAPPCPRGR